MRRRHPEVRVELVTEDRLVDILAGASASPSTTTTSPYAPVAR
jgi:hypothetical protein